VWGFAVICAALFFLSAWMLNGTCLLYSPAALAVLCGYSWMKRITPFTHFVLGLALGLAPVGAWMAITAGFGAYPILLGAAVLFWTAGFDLLYSCEDVDYDRQVGLKSIPAWLGIPQAMRLAAACHFVAFGLFVGAGILIESGWIYWAGMGLVVLLLIYEHLLVRPDDLRKLNRAFFYVNAVVGVTILTSGLMDLFLLSGRP
jgi:4-hydroxybenzoate polyprenyltransferase